MDHITTPDPSGSGSWLLILGCPRTENHELLDARRGLTGPSFATCASCEHQMGEILEHPSSEGWMADIFPERLSCGFPDGTPELA